MDEAGESCAPAVGLSLAVKRQQSDRTDPAITNRVCTNEKKKIHPKMQIIIIVFGLNLDRHASNASIEHIYSIARARRQ